ncbi:hypothetical protein O0L34_g19081 [Tuta absoluta]|nr:hypothetical protein O0L34_g19081 [Tuta absoluta]
MARLNNVEIKGVPLRNNENLFKVASAIGTAINYATDERQINYIARVPVYGSNEKNIIITFLNRYVKENYVAAFRSKKTLLASEIGFTGNKSIFINDHLTPDSKKLLTKAKALKNEKNYAYIWVKFCKIHIRKNDTSPVIIINSENDLNKII